MLIIGGIIGINHCINCNEEEDNMSKIFKPIPMSKKDAKCFGEDGKLKIIKQWIFKGNSYSARRDTEGYITIVDDSCYYGVGNSGIDYCFLESAIDDLAKKLGVM